MNKKQFIETLSNFVDGRMTEALVEQAEGKGYFEEPKPETIEEKIEAFVNTTLDNCNGAYAIDTDGTFKTRLEILPEMIKSLGIPKQVVFDNNSEFIATDIGGKRRRQINVKFAAPKVEASEQVDLGIDYISRDNTDSLKTNRQCRDVLRVIKATAPKVEASEQIKELMKKQAEFIRQIRTAL